MDVILHVGMGKTGTSAIQSALDASGDALAQGGLRYLGMRPVAAGEDPAVPNGVYLRADAETWAARADAVLACGAARGAVISNESFGQSCARMAPFVARLAERGARVGAVAFARDPRAWLPSAHLQWSVRHKTRPGPVRPFGEAARKLVNHYNGPIQWREALGEACMVVSYEAAGDVIAAFGSLLGVTLSRFDAPVYARPAPMEAVLRGLFNDRFAEGVLPGPFDRAVARHLRDGGPTPAREMARRVLDHSEVEAVVAERADLFARFHEVTGLDLLAGPAPEVRPAPDAKAVRDGMIDYLAEIVLEQARRLEELEERIEDLEDE